VNIMSCANRCFVLRRCALLAGLMLGCGTDNNADGIADAAGQVGADGDSGFNPDGSAGSSSSSDGGSATGNQGNNSGASSDAGIDGAATAADASVNLSDASNVQDSGSAIDPSDLPPFSFFVTSQAAIVELSQSAEGFGGDLRYGETGSGAGLRGADKICAQIAERSMEGASAKQWRAFLSASSGGASGGPVHARDRIGQGPWYDRNGRLVGNSITDLLSGDRPSSADPLIRDDLPNEEGVPNHSPNGTRVDNHDTLTGSDGGGRYVSGSNTCEDWTSTANRASGGGGGGSGPTIGHSWPRSATNGRHWVSEHRAGGCGKGINTANISSDGTATVGSGGGYGGFYCFALMP
jgi:hypothetical protein